LKRVYDPPGSEDGLRVLVDRLWPRGLSRESAQVDLWLRELAPSDELRRFFGHDPKRFAEFRRRYLAELEQRRDALEDLAARGAERTLTLLFAARDVERNNAVVLAEALAAL
jgi:uncharacterized protein YeaO (DUF488 family)